MISAFCAVELMQIAEGIEFIQRGWVNANMIVLHGAGETVVIDPGHFTYGDQCLRLLDGVGVRPESITNIIFTHSHWDHYSFADELRSLSGAPISTGPLTAEWLHAGATREMWLSYFDVVKTPLFSADKIITPYQKLTLAGRTWQAIPLPGHAPDILGYWQAKERVLISADSLVPFGDCGVLNVAVHGDRVVRDALETVDRIEALNPKTILPGHGGVIEDVSANIVRLRKRLRSFEADRSRLVVHFMRRIVAAGILEREATTIDDLIQSICDLQWAKDYAALVEQPPANVIAKTLDGLLASGAIRLENGLVYSDIPR